MIDREKVIKALTCCMFGCDHVSCPYNKLEDCEGTLHYDALTLLKEQEPKPPIITENAYGWKFYHCPSCGREFYTDRLHGRVNAMKFCDECGQAVKWDG